MVQFNNLEIEPRKGEALATAYDRAVHDLKIESMKRSVSTHGDDRNQKTKVRGLDYTPTD